MWNVVHRVRVREELKPICIYGDDPPEPLDPEWVGVIEISDMNEGRGPDEYAVALYGSDGRCLEWLQFETLQIALDQARAILGIEQDEWLPCRIPLPEDEGEDALRWTDLA